MQNREGEQWRIIAKVRGQDVEMAEMTPD